MKKRLLLFGTLTLLFLGAFTLFISSCSKARSFEVDGIKYEVLDSVDFACKVTGISHDSSMVHESVVIPDFVEHGRITYSVTEIGDGAFYGCEGLRSITSHNPQPPVCDEEVFCAVDASACVLYVPKGSKKAYSKAEGWKDFGKIVEM